MINIEGHCFYMGYTGRESDSRAKGLQLMESEGRHMNEGRSINNIYSSKMGHVTNGLTLAFNHLVWAKRRHRRRETGRVHVRKPCQNSTSQRKKWMKKISGAIYSEQTIDKTWQGQARKKKRTEQIHHAQAALIWWQRDQDSHCLYLTCPYILMANRSFVAFIPWCSSSISQELMLKSRVAKFSKGLKETFDGN